MSNPIVPNIPAQIDLSAYGIYNTGFITAANQVFTFKGDSTPDFLTNLENAKTMAQSVNDLLPKLIAYLNAYPTQ